MAMTTATQPKTLERSNKRQCCTAPIVDESKKVSLLISNIYQRTFNLPPKPLSFCTQSSYKNTSLLFSTPPSTCQHETHFTPTKLDHELADSSRNNSNNKNRPSSTTLSPPAKTLTTSKESTLLDDLLGQLEALDLTDTSPSLTAEPSPTLQLQIQILKTSRAGFQAREAIYETHYFEDIDTLYAQTEVPIPKGVQDLTDEENNLVDSILRKPQSGMVSQFKTAVVEFKDIYKLYPETWLNDEIINFYMVLLMDRANTNNNSSNDTDLPTIHCFNTFFCSTLRDQGYDKVKRWTKKVDVFAKDLLLIPINRSYHWTLGVIDLKNKQVLVYDSLNGKHHTATINLLLKYLELEHLDKKKTPFDTCDWKGFMPSSIPQQNNSSDCGVFACTFAERLSRNHPFDFNQTDMVSIRRRMVLDIKQKKLSI